MLDTENTPRASMLAVLEGQRAAALADAPVSLASRRDRLDRAIAVLLDNADGFCEALREDFGHRSTHQSLFTDIASSLEPLKAAKKQVARWMRPERRRAGMPFGLLGAKARIEYQPLGVVGVISPWNFPIQLTFSPLAGILAAGNRVMIKPSEFTPRTSALMAEAFAKAFDATEISVVLGGPQTGADFASLPFDHLLFTGATNVARHVMRAAAENLVPVTLELGGKSPVVLSDSAKLEVAARRLMMGKTLNAGQICLAPDYVMVPEGKLGAFVEASTAAVGQLYPTLLDNPDYTSIVNQRHYDRLQGYLDDARAKGAEVLELNPAGEDFRQQPHHKIAPHLILNPTDDMAIMQEEIFGPLLPVKTYQAFEETIDYVNAHPRPLGLYYFGESGAEERALLDRTTSGGVTLNDVIMHVAQEDLPFGGVGPSGMGAYHGYEGFKTFSHGKSIYRQSRIDMHSLGMAPPWGDKFLRLLRGQLKP